MDKTPYLHLLLNKLPPSANSGLAEILGSQSEVVHLDKNEALVPFQSKQRKIYFVAQGSFVRNIITSNGEEKTVMFHTESFCEFFKAYDTIFFHQATNYEIKANEKSVAVTVDYDFLMDWVQSDITLLKFYSHETEKLFSTIDLFRNYQLGLTSEEYLKWLYENYSFIFQRFSSQNIASFMGITNVWLSNLKAKLTI
ncbi:MAG: hypothetical protein LC105_10190 [Chitinophagales bacterium]|nr:hypothetical protein [Chitinophagales bacterium]MCZ2394216.1 hypothetical protein [Chitinophagales bacterium]